MTNHARTKRNIKKYKEKLFRNRGKVISKRDTRKMASLMRIPGKTFVRLTVEDNARRIARPVAHDHLLPAKNYNQRQRRKLWRQAPHLRKRGVVRKRNVSMFTHAYL